MVSSKNVVDYVLDSGSNLGVVAVYNTVGKHVQETADALRGISYNVIDSFALIINHCLCVLPETSKEEIEKIVSHPQAVTQCKSFLKSEFEGSEVRYENYEDTAKAAKMLYERKFNNKTAVICTPEAARHYGLKIIYEDMCKSKSVTRFIQIKRDLSMEYGINKMLVRFS